MSKKRKKEIPWYFNQERRENVIALVWIIFQAKVRKNLIQVLGAIFLIIALIIGVVGYLNQHMGLYLGDVLDNLIGDYYANASMEFISLAITVLVVDAIYRLRNTEREKADLVLQMGSPDNSIAKEAIRKLISRKWGYYEDETLVGAHFHNANLIGAILMRANLRGAFLGGANLSTANLVSVNLIDGRLEKADLSGANLRYAKLIRANLSSANLVGADLNEAILYSAILRDADLSNADLTGAKVTDNQLAQAKSLKDTILPDGSTYK